LLSDTANRGADLYAEKAEKAKLEA
jgi:hypothetical protein